MVTLYRQLIMAVIAALMVLYVGNLVVSFKNTKSLVAQQMETHAQDAATSLAFSMTQAAQGNDIATLETMLNAVSDGGYYKKIKFVDVNEKTVLERHFPVQIESVPQWFVNLMKLPDYQGNAEVSSGWVILGNLVVVSHPGLAYQNLWQAMLQRLAWFSLIGLGVCAIAFFAVRTLLRPLKEVENQANAICEQQFVQQVKLPRTRELRVVVEAMNRLSSRLEALFHGQSDLIRDLRDQSHTDFITGLSNRADFDARLNTFVNDESGIHSGMLVIVALNNLGHINEVAGRPAGNDALMVLGQSLQRTSEDYDQVLIARRQGKEFAFFIPDITEDVADALAASLMREVSRISWQHDGQLPDSITMGYTYSDEITNGPELLSEADMALHSLSSDGEKNWGKFSSLEMASIPTVSHSVLSWKQFIAQSITDKAIELLIQQIVSVPDRQLKGYEIYIRFRSPDDFELSAGTIVPMVQRFGYSTELDKLVLESLAEKAPPGDEMLVVNICSESICDSSFCEWLSGYLSEHDHIAQRLVVEVPEHALKVAEDEIRSCEKILARHGSGLAVDHFGLESSAFGYLASLSLRYLKVHRSFIKNIHLSRDNQFYVKALAQLAQTREVQLVVEGVETDAEWQVLANMNIDGAQGFLFGRPEALIPTR